MLLRYCPSTPHAGVEILARHSHGEEPEDVQRSALLGRFKMCELRRKRTEVSTSENYMITGVGRFFFFFCVGPPSTEDGFCRFLG